MRICSQVGLKETVHLDLKCSCRISLKNQLLLSISLLIFLILVHRVISRLVIVGIGEKVPGKDFWEEKPGLEIHIQNRHKLIHTVFYFSIMVALIKEIL